MNDYLDAVEGQLARLTERGAHRRLRARAPLGPLARRGATRGDAGGGRGDAGARRGDGGGRRGDAGGRRGDTGLRRGDRGGRRGRGPRRRADLIAVGGAMAVTAAVVAIVVAAGAGSRHPAPAGRAAQRGLAHRRGGAPRRIASGRSQPTSRSQPPVRPAPSGPVPAGFAPESFTAIGELNWWLLGSAPCSRPPCTSIVRTDDGGVSFVGIPAPRTSQVSQLRFADPEDGFAYGPQLWVTHDAGASWHEVGLGGAVTDLATAGGYAYAIVSPTGAGEQGRLVRSPVGSDRWSPLPAAGDAYAGLWARGSDVLLESAGGRGAPEELMVSHDDGASFTPYPPPPNVACAFQEPAPPVVWAHCATGMLSGVWRSIGYGVRFRASGGPHALPGPEMPNSAAFAAASATVAVVGYRQLYRTGDGGASWAPVATPAGITFWRYLGFTDSTHGVALGFASGGSPAGERLYYTDDGGLSYHLVRVG